MSMPEPLPPVRDDQIVADQQKQLEAVVQAAVAPLAQQLGEAREELGRVQAERNALVRRLEAAELQQHRTEEQLAAAQEQMILLAESGRERAESEQRRKQQARSRSWLARLAVIDRALLVWMAGMVGILVVGIVFHPDITLLFVLGLANLLLSIALEQRWTAP